MATTPNQLDINPPKPPGSTLLQTQANPYGLKTTQTVQNFGLDPKDISTEQRVAGLLSGQPNALTQALETNSAQQFQKRGLLNSSMAATGATDVLTKNAVDIANADANRLTGIAGTERGITAAAQEAERNRAFQSNEAAASRTFQGREAQATRDFQAAQADLNRVFERNAASTQLSAAFRDRYRTSSQATYDSYLRDIAAINTSDMTAPVKAAQIENLNRLYTQRQTLQNELFSSAPEWQADWDQIVIEFGKG